MDSLNSKISSNAEKKEWYQFLKNFRHSNATRNEAEAEFSSSEPVLDQIIKTLKIDKDEVLKVNLLIFLQENAVHFFEDSQSLEATCTALNAVLNSGGDSGHSFHFKGQILVTLTTILIELSVIRTQPRVFESYVEVLFEIIGHVNSGPERVLREMACQCLQEFEHMYPGLLTVALGHLLQFCQAEATHAAQAYLTLFATVLQHTTVSILEDAGGAAVVKPSFMSSISASAQSGGSYALLSTDADLSRFALSPMVRYEPVPFGLPAGRPDAAGGGRRGLPESANKDVQKSLSLLMDSWTLLTPWAIAFVVMRLMTFVRLTDLPAELMKHHFYKLAFTHSPLLNHLVLLLKAEFPAIFNPSDETLLLSGLFRTIQDPAIATEFRVLMVEWLLHFSFLAGDAAPDADGSGRQSTASRESVLFRHSRDFYPLVFDSLELKHAKLRALAECFRPAPSPFAISTSVLLDVLVCLDDFRWGPADSRSSSVVFGTLELFVVRFPELFDAIYKYLHDTVLTAPRFITPLIRMLNRIRAKSPESGVPARLLGSFNDVLVDIDSTELVKYLPLVLAIVRHSVIDLTRLLEALVLMLRRTTIRNADWEIGNTLLVIFRSVLQHQSSLVLFKPLVEGLQALAEHFEDLEIRDRALFFLELVTHVSGEKIKLILERQAQSVEEHTAGLFSGAGGESRLAPVNKQDVSFLVLAPKFSDLFSADGADGADSTDATASEAPDQDEIFGVDADGNPISVPAASKSASQFEEYFAFLNHPACVPTIDKPYILKYRSSLELRRSGAPAPASVFSAVLHFGSSPIFSPLPDVHVPYLAQPESPLSPEESDSFPYAYEACLSFQPQAPIPTAFPLEITYNDPDANTCKGHMEALTLDFHDLFLPVVVPPFMRQPKREFVGFLFEELWRRVLKPNLGSNLSPKQQKQPLSKGSKSVKHLPVPIDAMRRLLHSRLSGFLVASTGAADKLRHALDEAKRERHGQSDSGSGGSTRDDSTTGPRRPAPLATERALIFLPPRYHLLFKFQLYAESTVVKIRTDFWRVLICLDDFFASQLLPSSLKP